MHVSEARALIAGVPRVHHPQHWMDLGCGDGVFTRALAALLPKGSSIEAWDENPSALKGIPKELNGVRIATRTTDFLSTPLPQHLDGILIANALHYVSDQRAFLIEVRQALASQGLVVVAEYDTDRPVPTWVPHPISQRRLGELLVSIGFQAPTALGRRTSVYGSGDLYTVFAQGSASSPA